MWWEVDSGMGWWMLVETLFWVGLVVLGGWLLYSWAGPNYRGGAKSLDVARERYARGEITREEFQRMRDDLQKAA